MRANIVYFFENRVRAILLIIGSITGLLIFFLGNSAINGYLESIYAPARLFSDDAVLVYDIDEKYLESLLKHIDYDGAYEYYLATDYLELADEYSYNGRKLDRAVRLLGVDAIDSQYNNYITFHDDNYIMQQGKLLYGRNISAEDADKLQLVTIIEEYASEALFGKANGVGEHIKLYSYYGGLDVEVVGIVENLGLESEISRINRDLVDKEKELSIELPIYVPQSFIRETFVNDDAIKLNVLYFSERKINYKKQLMESINSSMLSGFGINSREIMLDRCDEYKSELRGILVTCMVVIVLFSGLVMATIYSFGAKERVYEIGIRRAIGASRFHIFRQFVLEGLGVAAFAAFLTVIFGTILINFVNIFMIKAGYFEYKLMINSKLIIAVFGLSALQGIIFSVVPAMLAAKTDPAMAIRWD